MSKLTPCIVGICIASAAVSVGAQTSVVVGRATTPKPSSRLINIVADTFQDTVLTGPTLERARGQSADQVITELCGSVSDAYFANFERLNGRKTVSHNAALGGDAATLHFPACLKIRFLEMLWRGTRLAATNDPFKAVTFAHRYVSRANAKGPVLVSARAKIAVPTELLPKPGVSVETALIALGGPFHGSSAKTGATAASSVALRGHIVELVNRSAIDEGSAQALACPAISKPFDPALIAAAYSYSLSHRPDTAARGRAHVVVVDNGFFGVQPGLPAIWSPAFPRNLFGAWGSQASLVGPSTRTDNGAMNPINYGDRFAVGLIPDDAAGHGTHVAGLAIGGPDFQAARDSGVFDLAAPPDNRRIDLEIINLGGGDSELLPGSERLLKDLVTQAPDGAHLPTSLIVNMSIAYEQPQADGTFVTLFQAHPQTLFVVAAGNSTPFGNDVGTVHSYPGDLGGQPNVISVAAHDAADDTQLAWFSDYGSKVSIAAPGCGIESWIDGSNRRALTGTSQAAPIVSFAAAALTSLDGSLTPPQIKARLLASGPLLAGQYRFAISSGSKLDIPAALILYEDIVEARIPDQSDLRGYRLETWIGDITDLGGLRCSADRARAADGRSRAELWAWKRQGDDSALFYGRDAAAEISVCVGTTAMTPGKTTPFVRFRRHARVVNGSILADPAPSAEEILPLSGLQRIVFKGPYAGSEK